MECEWCARGEENLCEHIMRTKVLGSYAEYLVIPAHIAKHNVFLKPGFVSFARAALLEPLACVTHGLSLLKMVKSDRVLVIGPGAIGLMFVAALRAVGIKDITLAGRNPSRLDVGAKMGAKTILLEEIPAHMGTGYDSVIECTGRVEIWERSIDFVRRTKRLHYDQITLISPFHFGTVAVRKAKALLEDLTIPFELLISGDRKLSEAEQVFEDLQRGRGIKYVFRP
jgi:L-iditol 2-dehydrogenase